jgi:triosephosphate isomerase
MARKKLIAANWKMYKTPQQARDFCRAFIPLVSNHERDEIVLCPPFVDLAIVHDITKETNIWLGAQDVFWEKEGAYTGEISAQMLKMAGCTHVIIGHSERRQFFNETDDTVNKKLIAALNAGLIPIVCIGEQLAEREAGLTDDILRRQCQGAFREIAREQARRITIAYEPVWAIGTGKTATPEMAAAAHVTIRSELEQIFGAQAANAIRILYGGSVKCENCKSLLTHPEIDGALVGGASLDPAAFAAIVKY